MVIDTSAVLAILLGEPEPRRFNERIEADPIRLMSAASYLETAIVIDERFGYEGGRDLRTLLAEAEIAIEPVTVEQAEVAREAYRRFGKCQPPRRAELRRLLCLCARQEHRRAAAVQGQRLHADDIQPC